MSGSITARSVIDRLIENPFRVLGLPADATSVQVDDAVGALKRGLKLNRTPTTNWDLPWMGPVTRTLPRVQTAASQLVQPPQRLRARVWWFSDANAFANVVDSHPWQAIARTLSLQEGPVSHHDAALAFLLACVLDDPRVDRGAWWGIALAQWDRLISSDAYWDYVATTEGLSGFEPAVREDDIKTIRSSGALVVADILTELADDALQRRDADCTVRILDLLDGAQATANVFSRPLKERVRQLSVSIRGDWERRLTGLCRDLNEQRTKTVRYQKGHRDENTKACATLAQQVETDVMPYLAQARVALGEGTPAARRVQESVADCLLELAKAWTWADQFLKAYALLGQGLAMVEKDSTVALEIETVMNNIREAVENERRRLAARDSVSGGPDLLDVLDQHGLEVIDKRPVGGSLWVIGGKKLQPLMKELRGRGFEFSYAEKGGRATGHRPAWYMRSGK